MAKDEVQFGYALLDDTKHIVNIDGIDRTYTRLHKFYCPHCHNEMYATFGEIQRPHFRHNGDKCQYNNYLHSLAEHVFFEEYSKCLEKGNPFLVTTRTSTPCNKACVLSKDIDCREHKEHCVLTTIDLTKEYKSISLESRVDINGRYRRPDILLESNSGRQLWVEIWVSHKTEEEKRKDGRIMEIKIGTEEDLKMIRQHRIVQSEGENDVVCILNFIPDVLDGLVKHEELNFNMRAKFPCELFYCFEVGSGIETGEVIDFIRKMPSPGLLYRVILRLNWKGTHKTAVGETGKQVTQNYLKEICSRRYHSSVQGSSPHFDNSFESLIVFEWKASSLSSSTVQNTTSFNRTFHNPISAQGSMPFKRSYHKSRNLQTPRTAPAPFDVSNMEWVDLGLPSGTLWAKEDIESTMSFNGARQLFYYCLPSYSNARELEEYCTKKWDEDAHVLVITGPNGNSILFPCKGRGKRYWLKEYEDQWYAKSFYIGPEVPGRFAIHESDVHFRIYVRLVST